jgi:arsenite transporter
MTLSTKDKQKPFILIAAMIAGVLLQRLIGGSIPSLIHVTQAGVFVVILAVMLPVELTDVGGAMRKVKPTALALFINFIFIPIVSWTLGWLFLRQYPDFWVGAILYTLTPCIGWYLIFTDIAKGDVAWGIALLPWNIVLQIALLPAYLYFLVGRVIPVDIGALAQSILLFLVAPFVLSFAIRRAVIAARGRTFFFGPFKSRLGDVKLWTFVVVILSMFLSQDALHFSELSTLGLLIAFLIGFFVVLFVVAVLAGRLFRLSYEDNATLAFTTTARNSEAVIGIAIAAFPGHPLVYLAIILGPIVELPLLVVMARIMLSLRAWIEWPQAGSKRQGSNTLLTSPEMKIRRP